MENNLEYRLFCKSCEDLPIFFKDWWLDSVCGYGNWLGLTLKSENYTKAIWPLPFTKYSFNRLYYSMPPLTPTLGIFFNYPEGIKYSSKLSFEKEVTIELLKKINTFVSFEQTFLPSYTNWLPFYWNGFKQTTRYTYRINDLKNAQKIFDDFQENIRREIRKAQKNKIVVEEVFDLLKFFEVVKQTYIRQNLNINISFDILKKIDENCIANDCRKILAAKDVDGNYHCVIYLVWDKKSMYYLIGGGNPNLRNSGATSLLIYESIKFAASKVHNFDFEGSILEPIERFFRAFGGVQTPIFTISKIEKKEKFLRNLIILKNKIWNQMSK